MVILYILNAFTLGTKVWLAYMLFLWFYSGEILYCISEVVSCIGLMRSSKLVKQCLTVKQHCNFLILQKN